MLRTIRIILIVVFVLALIWTGFLVVYRYTHDDISAPVFVSDTAKANGRDVLEVSVNASKEDLLQGLSAYDNMDGDISDRIMVRSISRLTENREATINYIVFDAASNYAVYSRTLRYSDYTPPKFKLTGPMVFNTGSDFSILSRIAAIDSIDGNISNLITIRSSTVMRNISGTYHADVSVKNRMGDVVELPLTVVVTNVTSQTPTITLTDYLVYARRGATPDFRAMIRSVSDPMEEGVSRERDVVINSSSYKSNVPGIYEIYYYYTSPVSGETAQSILIVIVQ